MKWAELQETLKMDPRTPWYFPMTVEKGSLDAATVMEVCVQDALAAGRRKLVEIEAGGDNAENVVLVWGLVMDWPRHEVNGQRKPMPPQESDLWEYKILDVECVA